MFVDHIVIRVNDLQKATGDYRQLGFTVIPGGEHKGLGSHNALIGLADDCYLELIAFPQAAAPQSRAEKYEAMLAAGESRLKSRWLSWSVAAEGLVDFAISAEAADGLFAKQKLARLNIDGPLEMGRKRPDGKELAWKMGFPETLDLPFLIADITPREWRVPQSTSHKNGVIGLSAIDIVVHNLEKSIFHYQQLLEISSNQIEKRMSPDVNKALFDCGTVKLSLVEPVENQSLVKQLQERGESPLLIELRLAKNYDVPQCQTGQTHGTAITFAKFG